MGITSEQSHAGLASGETNVSSAVERGLFNSALDFFGAAVAVIDYHGVERPRLRWDHEGLQGVRSAMGALERRIAIARRAGFTVEQIVRITRLDQDVIELIVARQDAAAEA